MTPPHNQGGSKRPAGRVRRRMHEEGFGIRGRGEQHGAHGRDRGHGGELESESADEKGGLRTPVLLDLVLASPWRIVLWRGERGRWLDNAPDQEERQRSQSTRAQTDTKLYGAAAAAVQ